MWPKIYWPIVGDTGFSLTIWNMENERKWQLDCSHRQHVYVWFARRRVAWEWAIVCMRSLCGLAISHTKYVYNSYVCCLTNIEGERGSGNEAGSIVIPFRNWSQWRPNLHRHGDARCSSRCVRSVCVHNYKCMAWISWIIGFIYALRIWKTWAHSTRV